MGRKDDKAVTVGFVALGCPKNVVDSEKMLADIGRAGFVLTGDADNADVVVINTCAFIEPAKQEAIEAIRQAVKQKEKGEVRKIIVAGCLPQRMGAELLNEVEGIDAVVTLAQRDRIGLIIAETMKSPKRSAIDLGSNDIIHDDRGRLLLTPRHWAYLRISEGCNRRCSFCTIPAIRGPFRSKPMKMVLDEAQELVANGAVELNIIAQDSNYYGRDLKITNGLSKLISEMEKIEGLRWIRLMYLYPAGLDEGLIETIAASEKVVNYIDMPIQHINDEILKAMRRPGSRETICRLIEKLRQRIDDVVLRTTVIVGFPGENDEQFGELLEFIDLAKFDALGCFKFYREAGTAAAEMQGQIAEEIKQQRFDELMRTQQAIVLAKNKERIGSELCCLVDSLDDDGIGVGRFFGQAPHIDSLCLIRDCRAKAGTFTRVKVVGTDGYDFVTEQI